MASSTILFVGVASALAAPILFFVLGRAVRAARDGDFLGNILPVSLGVVICIGLLMVSTAFLINALLPVVGSPMLAFFLIVAIQFGLNSMSFRLSGLKSA